MSYMKNQTCQCSACKSYLLIYLPSWICMQQKLEFKLCGFLPCLVHVQSLYRSDVTIQFANWLADGPAPTLVIQSLIALNSRPYLDLEL